MSSLHSKLNTDVGYYPLFMNIAGKTCLVVGGGAVAERKVRMLLKFNAVVKLVSPEVTKGLLRLAETGRLHLEKRDYIENDLEGVVIAFAATDVENINSSIRAGAQKKNIPVNVVDNPRLCDFIVPSIVKKGPIVIAISTSGTLPSLSKRLKGLIADEIGNDYVRYADIVGKARKFLLDTEKDGKKRRMILSELGKMDIKEVNRMGFRKVKELFLTSGNK